MYNQIYTKQYIVSITLTYFVESIFKDTSNQNDKYNTKARYRLMITCIGNETSNYIITEKAIITN